MANNFKNQPIYIDTDMGTTGFLEQSGILANQQGLFVNNVVVSVPSGNTVAAGNISITDPSGTNILLELTITSSTIFPVVVPFYVPMQWKDFAVNGQATTKTALQIWYR